MVTLCYFTQDSTLAEFTESILYCQVSHLTPMSCDPIEIIHFEACSTQIFNAVYEPQWLAIPTKRNPNPSRAREN